MWVSDVDSYSQGGDGMLKLAFFTFFKIKKGMLVQISYVIGRVFFMVENS